MADWSSLPGDLVNRIADRLLATNDLDYYMDLRGVCRGWRSSTADPKSSPWDPRFRPRQWAMLDEVHQSDDARLFVNAGTGRFVRKDLSSLCRRYFIVAGAAGGSVVLAERSVPHAARVLNPFTGATVRFQAPVPAEEKFTAHVIGSKPTLVLLSDHFIYRAHPDSKSFAERIVEDHFDLPPDRLAFEVAIYAAAREDASFASLLLSEATTTKIMELAECFPGAEAQVVNRCFLVESAGEMLIVLKMPHRVEVFKFKMDAGSCLLQRVKNLGSRALFVGDCRCLSVDANKFASVEANCIYYVVEDEEEQCYYDVCVYNLKDDTELRAGGAINSFDSITLSVDSPFSEVQLLCSYTFEVRYYQLEVHEMLSRIQQAALASGLVHELAAGNFSEPDDFSDIEHLM